MRRRRDHRWPRRRRSWRSRDGQGVRMARRRRRQRRVRRRGRPRNRS